MNWQEDHQSLRLATLAGGDSAERDISLASGACMARALAGAGHHVETIDPAATDLGGIDWSRFDACAIALHGGAGEDGRIQSQLARWGVAYTGSGPAASRLAMSKSASKERFAQAGIDTPTYALVHATDDPRDAARRLSSVGWPAVVKPDAQGSSLGVSWLRAAHHLPAALATAFAYDDFAVVEAAIVGREFTVTVLGRQALEPLEIVAPATVFDYQAKYHADGWPHRFDSGLPSATVARLADAAVAAAAALGTAGLVRVDLMLDRRNRPWVLEVNTVPGMTAHSLAPRAARRAGLDMPALCQWMIDDCLTAEIAR